MKAGLKDFPSAGIFRPLTRPLGGLRRYRQDRAARGILLWRKCIKGACDFRPCRKTPPAVIISIEQWYPYTDAFAVQEGSETETLENLFAFSPYYLECYAENGTSYTAVVEWDFSGIDLNTVGLYHAAGS